VRQVTVVAPLNEAYNLETSVQVFVLLAGAVSLVVRFRRSGPVERQQLKWFMYAAAVSAPVIFVVSNLVANPLPAFEIFFPLIPVAVAVATLAAAALFNPLRRRVQRMVDRRFNRARYDAEVTVAAFAARLKDSVDLDAVRDDLAGVVTRALEPAHVSVWISRPG